MSGSLFVITAPSGAGKTTIVLGAIETSGTGKRVITCTTRPPEVRDEKQEIDGVDYRFFTKSEFERRRVRGEFAECAEVFPGRWYGTLHADIDEATKSDKLAYLICDVLGAKEWIKILPSVHSIFINVSRQEMRARLYRRGMRGKELETRMKRFAMESAEQSNFDFVLWNKNGHLAETIDAFIAHVASCFSE
jgi:guanylate kinase